ncbi:hypothetical protein [Marinobacter alexandrii]|uniref:hypothetical protein n=1 Tax=Marinobacter alexandrii TaxID=2570351 RepID=UPI003264D01C
MAIKKAVFHSLMAMPLCLCMASGVSAEETERLVEAREALQSKVDSFDLLTNEQLLTLEKQFADLIHADSKTDLTKVRQTLEQAGFEWQWLEEGLVMLTDRHSKGLGHYLFRLDSDLELMLQAPHQFYDRHTGQLAIDLFLESKARVLALNSAHRRLKINDRTGNADMAHLEGTAFGSLTRAFGLSRAGGVVVQLHGFAAGKRTSEAGRDADIIVSSGQRWLQPVAERFSACLSEVGRWNVLRFPVDVGELGGTTNTQGVALRHLGNNRFVHLELSRDLREKLIGDSVDFNALNACLIDLNGGL